MRLPPEEPDLGPWEVRPTAGIVSALLRSRPPHRPAVVAVDGRSGSGKTTLATSLFGAATAAGHRTALVHTDDVAWHQSRFDWDRLLASGVLRGVRAGEPVRWRPPAWVERGRPGAIAVAGDLALLLVEGVGAARRSLVPLLDVAVWVQADFPDARERAIRRDQVDFDRTPAEAADFWEEWMSEELPYLAADRPWTRADLVVAGSGVGWDPGADEAVVAAGSRLAPDVRV